MSGLRSRSSRNPLKCRVGEAAREPARAAGAVHDPSLILAVWILGAGMAFVAVRSPDRLGAGSVVGLTLFAVVASPGTIRPLLHAITGSHAQSVAAWLCRFIRNAALAVYFLFAFLAALAFLGGAGQGAAVVIFFGIVAGALEGVARATKSLLRDLAYGGEIDRKIAAIAGSGVREVLVGILFIVGSCLGLAATFT